jgi:hypothetical protein
MGYIVYIVLDWLWFHFCSFLMMASAMNAGRSVVLGLCRRGPTSRD